MMAPAGSDSVLIFFIFDQSGAFLFCLFDNCGLSAKQVMSNTMVVTVPRQSAAQHGSTRNDVIAAVTVQSVKSTATGMFGCLNPLNTPFLRRLPKTSWKSNHY
jgi:hypothetical protein